MRRICIVYHTTDGHTRAIADFLKQSLQCQTIAVTLLPLRDFYATDIPTYDVLIIGASIRYGKHARKVRTFLEDHATALQKIQTAFFSVNLVARKADKNTPETNPYTAKFLQNLSWRPDTCAVFAGKLDYARYGFFDRWMIRLIMKLTNGPTRTEDPLVFTDWDAVAAFAQHVRYRALERLLVHWE
ncbi:menaquinone-dependent protoporphyrinogen oxidase [Pustulibacterium marinum]|uniref:Protoporphyrinogen IX dehydrogenase [quinone] n=1 Tax=Pustulibacterium marinum TaxID=1224947 RepID=A0A1I7HXV0_9FLAO|nr:menaquinone-dependent protoporphyrinogen IX dehydrogenase [Pustulibacterium marinum]SFU65510.1 menaquinone-dependent protoporphyrinogen oxidase [Pustulibacterium marinum]